MSLKEFYQRERRSFKKANSSLIKRRPEPKPLKKLKLTLKRFNKDSTRFKKTFNKSTSSINNYLTGDGY